MPATSSTPWVEGLTIGQVLAQTAARHAANDAIVFPALGVRSSYAQFERDVYECAKGLLAMGVRRGQHVALWATNVPQWIVLQFATARIGAVLVTINPAYRPFELKYVLRQSDSVALFLVDHFKSSDYHAMLNEVCPQLKDSVPGSLNSPDFPELKWVVNLKGPTLPGSLSFAEMLDRGRTNDAADLQEAERGLKPS
jgi:fatty-acyl-CoA synthase